MDPIFVIGTPQKKQGSYKIFAKMPESVYNGDKSDYQEVKTIFNLKNLMR